MTKPKAKRTGLLTMKIGMTRVFTENGDSVPVTVIEAGPCRVIQVKPDAVQLGFGEQRKQRVTQAELGHAKLAGLEAAPAIIREFGFPGDAPATGSEVKVDIFAAGERVKVTGTTKGRGFQGIVHRYGAGGGPASHGNTRHRKPGSIGPGTEPEMGVARSAPSSACMRSSVKPGQRCASLVRQSWLS